MSLAEQLKRLQIPGQSSTTALSTHSSKQSILFDPSTAATLDNETILNIASKAFGELCSMDSVFTQYEHLFNKKSLHMQREMKSKEFNKKLAVTIGEFLLIISPYVQLKCTHQVLEWLVRRFCIHVHDKQALVAAILPYHESKIFARIAQLFGDITNDGLFDFLHACKKSGIGFSTNSLVQQCIRNRNLLVFIQNTAAEASGLTLRLKPKSGLKVYFSFYTRLLLLVVNESKKIGEDFLAFMLPTITDALKSGHKDYVCSMYMIVGLVCTKAILKEDVVQKLLLTIVKSLKSDWYEEGFICMLTLAIHQDVKKLQSKFLKRMLKLETEVLVSTLSDIRREFENTSTFIGLLLPALSTQKEYAKLLCQFIDADLFTNKQISTVTKLLITKLLECEDEIECWEKALKKLCTRFSGEFDEVLSVLYKENESNATSLSTLKQITELCLSPARNQNVADLPLVLGLNHPSVETRIAAVEQLFLSVKSGDFEEDEAAFFKDAILARLQDDSPEVINAVLKFPKSLVNVVPSEELQKACVSLVKRTDAHFYLNNLFLSLAAEFEDCSNENGLQFVYTFLCHIFYAFSQKKNAKFIKGLKETEFLTEHPILKGIKTAIAGVKGEKMDCNSSSKVFSAITKSIAQSIHESKNALEHVEQLWKFCQNLDSDHDLQFVSLMIYAELMVTDYATPLNPQLAKFLLATDLNKYLNFRLSENMLPNLAHFKTPEKASMNLYKSFYSHLKEDKPQDFFALAFLFVCNSLTFHIDNSEVELEKLFGTLATQAGNEKSSLHQCFRVLLSNFLLEKFNSKADLVGFLCKIYIHALHDDAEESLLRSAICALQITGRVISANDYEVTRGGNVVIVHVALLASRHTCIRRVVTRNIPSLLSIVALEKKNPWNAVLKKIVECQTEINMDSTYINRIFEGLFTAKKSNDFAAVMKKSKTADASFITKDIAEYPHILQLKFIQILHFIDVYPASYLKLLEITLNKPADKLDICDTEILVCLVNQITTDVVNADVRFLKLLVKSLTLKEQHVQESVCKKLTSLYCELKGEHQHSLLNQLLDELLQAGGVELSTRLRILFKSIKINAQDCRHIFDTFCKEFDQDKKRKDWEESETLKSTEWRRVVELLHCLNTQGESVLAPSLFQLLARVLQLSGESIEYVKQLILTLILSLLDHQQNLTQPFELDVVIKCLQSTQHLLTSQHCLAVLAKAALHFPTQVLENVMQIFTFMGGTMMKVDNEHTFKEIERTIDAVVPIIIDKRSQQPVGRSTSRKRSHGATTEKMVRFILETFVDALPHCPEHRRAHILRHLVLRAEQTLDVAVELLIKKAVKQSAEVVEDLSSPITLDFCKSFLASYPSHTQLDALRKNIDALNSEEFEKKRAKEGHQRKQYSYTLFVFAKDVLENCQPDYTESFSNHVVSLLESLISFADVLRQSNQEDNRFNLGLTQKVLDAIGVLYTMLPFDPFIVVILGLLRKDNPLVRKKSLELLCNKLDETQNLTQTQEEGLLEVSGAVITLVHHKEGEHAVTQQILLYALKLLASRLCHKNAQLFLDALPVVTQLFSVVDGNSLVAVNAVLCTAELVAHLKAAALPYLPLFMKPVLQKIDRNVQYPKNDLTLTSCVTSLQKILVSLPQFMSPYVRTLLEKVAVSEAIAHAQENPPLLAKVNSLKEQCGKLIPPRVLYKEAEAWLNENLKENKDLAPCVAEVLRHSFIVISKQDANTHFNAEILAIFKLLLNYDVTGTAQAFCELVLKLSENTLRPMYLKLFKWCCESVQRLCTFYKLSVKLSVTLKSLFPMFAGQTIKKSVQLVTDTHSNNQKEDTEEKNSELLVAVLDTLSNIFHFDHQGFVNKERFDSLMQPLVDQLENDMFAEQEHKSFITDHLLPCLVNFASAVNNIACWKPLTHQILLKTKSSQAHVRLAALEVMEEVYKRMGESYMSLVPETIPFLAEVLEDDSSEVEAQCQRVIKQIETITGESMQKYL